MYKPTLSRKDHHLWTLKNQYATMRFFEASDDYAAARCCILNGLFPGFVLACQAVERMLKAHIYFATGKKMMSCHNVFELKEKLKRAKDVHLDKYDGALKKLWDHYQQRYYENKISGQGASSEELHVIDELWLDLAEKMPLPDEIKYRMKFFADLFEPRLGWLNGKWLMVENKALEAKIKELEIRYKEVRAYPYVDESPTT